MKGKNRIHRRDLMKKIGTGSIIGVIGSAGIASAARTKVIVSNANEFNDSKVHYSIKWTEGGISADSNTESDDESGSEGHSYAEGYLHDNGNADTYYIPPTAMLSFVRVRTDRESQVNIKQRNALNSMPSGEVDVSSRDSDSDSYVFWSTGDISGIASTTEFKQDAVRPAFGNCAEERAKGRIKDGKHDRYNMTGQFCEISLSCTFGGDIILERDV